jgi:catechol 2,3-dioxygenase-like lactoylglutathione lyase family enzyme
MDDAARVVVVVTASRGGHGMAPTLGWPFWIGVVVDDLEAQRRLWAGLLGVPEDHAGEDFVSFRMPDGRWFELVQRSDEPEYDAVRFQVGFEVEDIEIAVADLEGRGLERIAGPYLEHPEPWAYFRDPEGHVFEIKQRGDA